MFESDENSISYVCLMNTSFNLILFYGEDSDEIGTLRLCYVT